MRFFTFILLSLLYTFVHCQTYYPLICRGFRQTTNTLNNKLEISVSTGSTTSLTYWFFAGNTSYEGYGYNGMPPGTCTWLDRGFRTGEPTKMIFQAFNPFRIDGDSNFGFIASSQSGNEKYFLGMADENKYGRFYVTNMGSYMKSASSYAAPTLAPPTPAPTPKPAANWAIYIDSLGTNWQDWSWGTNIATYHNMGAVAPAPLHSAPQSIMFTPRNWNGLKLNGPNLNTNTYKGVSFWIHGGTTGGQNILFAVYKTGNPVAGSEFNVGSLISGGLIPPNVWSQVTITFTFALGQYDGIWFADDSGTAGQAANGALYIDDIFLLGR